jgi:DNA polymerase III delta subunit
LSAREIAKRLNVHEFRIRKALAHADRYTEDELDAAVVRLAALDAAIKGASRLSGEHELTRALVALARAPAPQPVPSDA